LKTRNIGTSLVSRRALPEFFHRVNARKWTTRSTLSLIALSALLLSGCGGNNALVGGGQGNPVFLTSISMTPVNPSVAFTVSPAATTQFVVIGTYSVGNPKDITGQMTWASLDAKVASIDSTGMATAIGSGRVVVTAQIFEPATQKTLQASTVLTVVPQLTGIQVIPATAQIAKNTSQQFTATGKYNDSTQADITSIVSWSSSTPAAAVVSSSPGTQGRSTGVSSGSTNIVAALGSITGSAALNVTNANLVSLSIQPANPTVPLRTSKQLSAVGTFDDGSSQDISTTVLWNSSDSRLGRVSSAGALTGVGIGTAQITATASGLSNSTNVTVDPSSVQQVTVLPVSAIASATRVQLHAMVTLQDGATFDATHTPGVLWMSSDSAVADITADSGVLAAKAPGSATISAQLGSHTGSAALKTADATIQSLSIAPNPANIAPGTTENMIALATFSVGSGKLQQDVSSSAAWSSDQPEVVDLSFNGMQEIANAHSSGIANVSALFADMHGNVANGSSVFNVSSAALTAINVAPGNVALTAGGGQQFLASGTFSDGTTQDLTLAANWSAEDVTITEVDPHGFSIASGAGQTSVAAAIGSQSGSSVVVVNRGALSKIDICAATISDPLNNCPPLDPLTPPPPISFAKAVPFGLMAIGTFTDGIREDLTSSVRWTTSNPATAAISNEPGIPGLATGIAPQGFITGVVAGHVTVSAAAGEVSGSTDVIVTDATPAFLTVTPANSSIRLGFTQQLTATVTFSDGTTSVVTPYVNWATSDPAAVVVYAGGLAYAAGTGTSSVAASFSTVQGSTTLTVQ